MHTNAHGHLNARLRAIEQRDRLRESADLITAGYIRGDDDRERDVIAAVLDAIETAAERLTYLIDLPVHWHLVTEHKGIRQRAGVSRDALSDVLLSQYTGPGADGNPITARAVQCTCENGERILADRDAGRKPQPFPLNLPEEMR